MASLTDLSYEVLSYIIGYLNLHDIYCFGRTSKSFKFIFEEERMCKFILQTKLRYSNEALAAVKAGGGNAHYLRRVLKRHDALATASPFIVATIGFCDFYLYREGMLCYMLDDRIRVLHLHRSARSELVISIPLLLSRALVDVGDKTDEDFQILYYSEYILSCTYRSSGPDSTTWLVAFNLRNKEILVAHGLDSISKLFVRHNKHYLYYGTHSEIGADGYTKWVIYGYDFKERKWFPQKVHLSDMVGFEIGSTICFELYDGYFYGLSNRTSFEVEEIDWTSFYHCIRFPLSSPCRKLLEKTENERMWRRQHEEGPIDDRWTHLRLVKDESSGKLKIIEGRMEWCRGGSKSRRNCYTTDLIFPKASDNKDTKSSPNNHSSNSSGLLPFDVSSWLPDLGEENNSTGSTSSAGSTSSSASTPTTSEASERPFFPDEQLTKLIQNDDHPNYIAAPNRRPENTHPEHDSSAQPRITLANCRLRAYNPSCSTFLDLVNDPYPDDWQSKPRLRLRAGTRNLGPVLRDTAGLLREPSSNLSTALHKMYRVPPITYWPDAQAIDKPDQQLDAIYRLMSPPSHLGNVERTSDERSMVYTTGGPAQLKALIFISFDPSIRLAGLEKWSHSQRSIKETFEGHHVDHASVCHQQNPTSIPSEVGGKRGNWAWKERAMYQDIDLGYYFGLDRKKI